MRDLRCLLVRSPRLAMSQFTQDCESLALAYLCSTLRKAGFHTEIIDGVLLELSIDETVRRISQNDSDIIGFTIPDPSFVEPTVLCIRNIKKTGVRGHITIGGYTPTFHYSDILISCPEINSVVMYEGEETITELANALESNEDWKGIDGIAFKNGSEVFANQPRRLIQDLNSIPFPARDTLPCLIEKSDSLPNVSLLAGRGCYANCTFCAVHSFYSIPEGPSIRFRTSDNIADEIELITGAYDLREFVFVDDIFIGPSGENRKRAFRFARELENRKLNILFSISDRVENIDYEIIKRLKEVGLWRVFLGLESANQRRLNSFNKGITLRDTERAMQILEDSDLDVEISFINFTPDNTIEEIEQNLDFFLHMDVNILRGLLNRLKPYGGSKIFSHMRELGKLKGSFPYYYCDNHKDQRVNLLYEIVKDCFGFFIPVSYNISEVKRRLRRKLFESEKSAQIQDLSKLKCLREKFHDLQKTIMLEASGIFREAMDFVKKTSAKHKQSVTDFKKSLVKESILESENWLNMITFFDKHCLNENLQVKHVNEN